MITNYADNIARELQVKTSQVLALIKLLEEGGTVPFIARYRKEATGSLDEVAITAIRDRLDQLTELDKRREAIINSLTEQGKLTDDLRNKIAQAPTMAVLEDIYLPYKPKRRTRATIAKEKGLEPLALKLFAQDDFDVLSVASQFISKEHEIESAEDALAGARDIIAEWVNEDAVAREKIRELFRTQGLFISGVLKDKEQEGQKYKDYFNWSEPVASAPSHRILAMRRGSAEKILSMRIEAPQETAFEILAELFIKADNQAAQQVRLATIDSYKRLLCLSMETEIRMETKKRADEEAIKVFSENLRQLLLAAPLGPKRILALDPGFRTGCKLVCLDAQGKLLYNDAVFPHTSSSLARTDGDKIKALCQRFEIEAIAIGNGTAGRETQAYVNSLGLPENITVIMVNESGASVYSASDVAREEFPDHDVTVRGAVSIGRRLMDPLAELVKIDPKSIGVGQYQHDVDQKQLKQSLDDTVISCVNNVCVDINTASKQLLTYVSCLGTTLADRIVKYRNENGRFDSRNDIKKVPGLGAKSFEQCAGFLRIPGAQNPLDASAVHPESYPIVEAMAKDLGCSVIDLIKTKELRDKISLTKYVTEQIGLPTLTDIKEELNKPGRDPRDKFEIFSFKEGVNEIRDLEPGMKLPGIVTNITAFGAFVDIGVHQDGMVHISQLADKFVSDPNDVVKVHQKVEVTVMEVDIERKRKSLSMKKNADPSAKAAARDTAAASKPKLRSDKKQDRPRRESSSGNFGESLGLQIKL